MNSINNGLSALSADLKNNPLLALLISLVTIFFSLIIFSFLGVFIASLIFKIPFAEVSTRLASENLSQQVRLFKFMQIFQTIGVFIIPGWVLFKYFGFDKPKNSVLQGENLLRITVLVLFTLVVSLPFLETMMSINEKLSFPAQFSGIEQLIRNWEDKAIEITKILLKAENLGDFAINLLMIALLPAIGEELIFRGVFQNIFIRWTHSPFWAIFITATLFSAFHLQFFGFLPRFLLGLFLGFIYFKTNKLYIPIFAHFANNAIVISISYYYGNNTPISSPAIAWYVGLASATLTLLLIIYFSKTIRKMELNLNG